LTGDGFIDSNLRGKRVQLGGIKKGKAKGLRKREGGEGGGMGELSLQMIGPPRLTRFERARIVGARALQLSMGARPLIDLPSRSMSPREVAILELEEGILPLSIRRMLPDGTSQNIPLKSLLGDKGGD
jgi:DNA-directed RNA polymerase subunit K/omega